MNETKVDLSIIRRACACSFQLNNARLRIYKNDISVERNRDHRLVRTRVSLSIQRPHRKCATKLPRRLNTARLKEPVTQQRLSVNVKAALELAPLKEGLELDEIWGATRDAVYKASFDTLGTNRRRNQEWFDENDQHIQCLLENKRASNDPDPKYIQ